MVEPFDGKVAFFSVVFEIRHALRLGVQVGIPQKKFLLAGFAVAVDVVPVVGFRSQPGFLEPAFKCEQLVEKIGADFEVRPAVVQELQRFVERPSKSGDRV